MASLQERSIQIILRYQSPNGAYVACPNFEQYRYCWLRDGSFVAYAMDLSGRPDSARRFFGWVHHVLEMQAPRVRELLETASAGAMPRPAAMLPARYRLDGSPEESGAWPNFQLDGYGVWLWALAEHVRRTGEVSLLNHFAGSIGMVTDYLIRFWSLPNYDCWEESGDRIHTATLACIYGGLKAVNAYRRDPEIDNALTAIRQFILDGCVGNGRLVKFRGSTGIDASLLWACAPFAVLPWDSPLMQNTVREIEKQLLCEGGVRRYPEDTYYGGGEWLLLSSWLGWYYCKAGDPEAAAGMLRWVEAQADADGEMVEQVSRHVNQPSFVQPWVERWGPVAKPLLWSHAMHLVLLAEISQREPVVFNR